MGFQFELVIVWPHILTRRPEWFLLDSFGDAAPPPPVEHKSRVWQPTDSLNLGSVTRVEKLHMPHIRERFSDRSRAAICFSSVIVHGLFDLLEDPPLGLLAPPFLLYGEGEFLNDDLMDKAQAEFPDLVDRLDFGARPRRDLDSLCFPSRFPKPGTYEIVRHHDLLRLPEGKRFEKAMNGHPVLSPAVFWLDFKNLSHLFEVAEATEAVQWASLAQHPIAKAQYLAWTSYVKHLADTPARAVFVFD